MSFHPWSLKSALSHPLEVRFREHFRNPPWVQVRVGEAFPKHAVNTSLYALLRHPWLRKVLERPPPPNPWLLSYPHSGAVVPIDERNDHRGLASHCGCHFPLFGHHPSPEWCWHRGWWITGGRSPRWFSAG